MLKKEIKQRIQGLDEKTARKVVCALIGHSRIQRVFFGYYNCSRCDAQLGDNLGGYYDDSDVVILGHDCQVCRENAEKLTWKDRFMAPSVEITKNV